MRTAATGSGKVLLGRCSPLLFAIAFTLLPVRAAAQLQCPNPVYREGKLRCLSDAELRRHRPTRLVVGGQVGVRVRVFKCTESACDEKPFQTLNLLTKDDVVLDMNPGLYQVELSLKPDWETDTTLVRIAQGQTVRVQRTLHQFALVTLVVPNADLPKDAKWSFQRVEAGTTTGSKGAEDLESGCVVNPTAQAPGKVSLICYPGNYVVAMDSNSKTATMALEVKRGVNVAKQILLMPKAGLIDLMAVGKGQEIKGVPIYIVGDAFQDSSTYPEPPCKVLPSVADVRNSAPSLVDSHRSGDSPCRAAPGTYSLYAAPRVGAGFKLLPLGSVSVSANSRSGGNLPLWRIDMTTELSERLTQLAYTCRSWLDHGRQPTTVVGKISQGAELLQRGTPDNGSACGLLAFAMELEREKDPKGPRSKDVLTLAQLDREPSESLHSRACIAGFGQSCAALGNFEKACQSGFDIACFADYGVEFEASEGLYWAGTPERSSNSFVGEYVHLMVVAGGYAQRGTGALPAQGTGPGFAYWADLSKTEIESPSSLTGMTMHVAVENSLALLLDGGAPFLDYTGELDVAAGGYAAFEDTNSVGVLLRGGLKLALHQVGSHTAGATITLPKAELGLGLAKNAIEIRGSLGLSLLASVNGKLETLLVERGAVVALNQSNFLLTGSFTQLPLHFVGSPEGFLRFQLRACWFPMMKTSVGGCVQASRDEAARADNPARASNALLVMFGWGGDRNDL